MYSEAINYLENAFMHSAPRFGFSNNIALLASAAIERRWNYIFGIIYFCVFLISFFIIWGLLELIFKCLGLSRVGCLAGQMNYKQTDIHLCESKIRKKHRIIRLAFLFACGTVFVGGGVALKYGLTRIDLAVKETVSLSRDVQTSLNVGLEVAQSVDRIRSSFTGSNLTQLLLSKDSCNNNGTDIASIIFDSSNEYNKESLTTISKFQNKLSEEQTTEVISGFQHILDNLHNFESILVFYSEYHWIARMFMLILFNFCLFLMISGIVTMRRSTHFPPLTVMTSYVILPCAILLLIVVWIVTGFVSTIAIMNSDFCVGNGEGPESTIKNALLENGFNTHSLTYQSFDYYDSQCTTPSPWESHADNYAATIEQGLDLAEFLSEHIRKAVAQGLLSSCGENTTIIIKEIDDFKKDLKLLSLSLGQALELSRCDRVTPMYQSFFDGPLCESGLSGLSWAFYGLFFVSIGGAMMVTLRSALYEIHTMHTDDLDSMDETADHKKGLQKEIHCKITTSQSYDSSSSDESDFVNRLECGIDSRRTEMQPLSPSPKHENLIGFTSPDSSLSSHFSDSLLSSKIENKITKW